MKGTTIPIGLVVNPTQPNAGSAGAGGDRVAAPPPGAFGSSASLRTRVDCVQGCDACGARGHYAVQCGARMYQYS